MNKFFLKNQTFRQKRIIETKMFSSISSSQVRSCSRQSSRNGSSLQSTEANNRVGCVWKESHAKVGGHHGVFDWKRHAGLDGPVKSKRSPEPNLREER